MPPSGSHGATSERSSNRFSYEKTASMVVSLVRELQKPQQEPGRVITDINAVKTTEPNSSACGGVIPISDGRRASMAFHHHGDILLRFPQPTETTRVHSHVLASTVKTITPHGIARGISSSSGLIN
jgi:hypothetical protein